MVGPHRQRCKEQPRLPRWEPKEWDLFKHRKGLLDILASQDMQVRVPEESLDILEELLEILVCQYTLIHMPEELDILEELATEDFHILEEEDFLIPELELPKDLGKHGLMVMPARVQPRLTRCGLR